jgi:signal transduction protein with GAF and PtsI domain
MRIDPAALAKSIGSLYDLDAEHNLDRAVQDAVTAAKLLFRADGAGLMLVDADGRLRWASASDERAQSAEDNQELFGQGPCMTAFAEVAPMQMRDARVEPEWGEITLVMAAEQILASLSVPVEMHGSPIGTLDVYSVAPREWDASEVSAVQAYAGLVANLLVSAVTAHAKGILAAQLQIALDHRVLIEQAKGALMAREGLDERAAFERIRIMARSSNRTAAAVARELLATVTQRTDSQP